MEGLGSGVKGPWPLAGILTKSDTGLRGRTGAQGLGFRIRFWDERLKPFVVALMSSGFRTYDLVAFRV